MTLNEFDRKVRLALKMRADGYVGKGRFQRAAIDMFSEIDSAGAPPYIMLLFKKQYSVSDACLSIIFNSDCLDEDFAIRSQKDLASRYS